MKTTTFTNSKLFQSIITVCIFSAFSIAQNTLSIEVGDGTIDVLYNSDADIGGFQFDVEGATVTGGSGGDATSNGFMISCNATTCLGFSMTGAVIPAGSGTLVVVSADITGDVSLSGIVVSDATGNALDFSFDDGGGGSEADYVVEVSSNVFTPDHLDISTGETVEWINMGGFHNVDGSTDTYPNNPDSFYSGSASSDSWTYSFTFDVAGNYDYQCNPHASMGMVGTIAVGSGGCMDDMACNYNSEADFDDGSCTYAETNYDCDGNCIAGEDCADVCGGDAVVDECGECGGDGIGGHACDCDGNVEDCAGNCGGSAVEDDCGVCGGDGTSCIPVQLGFGTVADGNMEILYDSPGDISGFQFDVSGVDVISASGGDAAASGFTTSTGNNTVLGFSFTGAAISAGSGVLTILNFEGSGEACLASPVVSNPVGEGYNIQLGDCATIDDTCASGIYDCAGVCDGAAVEDCAGVCGGSAENCPGWEDDPGAYEFTATIAGAIVLFDGVQLGDEGDLLAALDADGNVRGVGLMLLPPFGPYAGTPVYEVQLRSNDAGDLLHFQYYDASSDEVLDISETYEFVINDVIGDVIDPWTLNIQTTVDLGIDLIAGWNWISFNVDPEDDSLASVLATVSETATFINSQSSGTATNYGDYGWYGGLTTLDPTQMYLLDMSEAATLTVTGVPVDVASRPIDLISGWNWIGYLPQNSGDVETALASVGDLATFINSQSSGTATNYGDYGWYGGLTTLEPGSGYLLDMSGEGTLVYPEFDGLARLDANKQEVVLKDAISDWDFNYADYEFIGTIHASIESRIDFDGDVVGVFVDDKCRGIAERMYFPFDDSYFYIVQVYSNIADGEEMTFKYFDSKSDEVIEYGETILFTSNMVVGDGFNTFALSREVGDLQQPIAYGISDAYPNPFNPVTSFEYTLEKDGMVQVAVYDINGRMVSELVNGYQSAGSYPVVWDAQELSSGVYMVNMIAGDYSTIQKVMLIK